MATDKRNSDIEVLRAVAILFTLYHHRVWLVSAGITRVVDPYLTFWGGVDIFLVISGFVIGRSLLSARARAVSAQALGGELMAFWIRRIWRIWPLAWLWALIPLAMSLLSRSGSWGNFLPNLSTVSAILMSVENIHAYLEQHHMVELGAIAFGPYWSLSLEEQFYLLMPLLLFFLPRRPLPWVLGGVAIMQIFWPRNVWGLGYALRSDALCLGVLIAWSMDRKLARRLAEPRFLAQGWVRRFCLGLLCLFNAAAAAGDLVPFYVGLVAIVSAVMVWIASYDEDYVMAPGMTKRLLMAIGERSYAIYLTHMPVFIMTHEIWAHLWPSLVPGSRTQNVMFLLTAFGLGMLVVELCLRLVERPLRARGRRLAAAYLANQQCPSVLA